MKTNLSTKAAQFFFLCMLLDSAITHVEARQHRSSSAKHAFQSSHPCPANGATKGGCKGYVIDHIKPLACGGADAPSNMQWQTVQAGKAKDKWERKQCRGQDGRL